MEKKLLVLSNASSPGGGSKNTLVNFKTPIPENFLEPHKRWAISIESMGMHFRLKNPIVPKDPAVPSLLQINLSDFNRGITRYNLKELDNLPREMFLPHHMIFIDGSRKYKARQLVHHIKSSIFEYASRYKNAWSGVPVQFNKTSRTIDFGQFLYNDELNDIQSANAKNNARTFVFIHKTFAKELMFVKEDVFGEVTVGGEPYLYFFNSFELKQKAHYPILSKKKEFPIKKPDLVQILSQNIRKTITNGTQLDVLKQFSVDDDEIGTYVKRSFIQQDFLELVNSHNTSLEFRIVDENSNLLRLQPGFPTYLKLTFCPVKENTMTKDYLRISSIPTELYPLNKPASFRVNLGKTLDYTYKKDPKIALSSITIENEWKILPGLLLDAQLVIIGTGKVYTFTCPRDGLGPRTCPDICKWFEKQLKPIPEVVLSKVDGKYLITFKSHCFMLLSRDLGQILGMSFMDSELRNTSIHVEADTRRKKGGYQLNFFHKADENNMFKQKILEHIQLFEESKIVENFFARGNIVLSGESETAYMVPYVPREIELFPHLLFIYCNCVKPSPINDTYRQLLRIASLSDIGDNSKKITIEFNQLEFVPLSQLNIKLLEFNIATHDNLHIELLNEQSVVYLNLLLKYDQS